MRNSMREECKFARLMNWVFPAEQWQVHIGPPFQAGNMHRFPRLKSRTDQVLLLRLCLPVALAELFSRV